MTTAEIQSLINKQKEFYKSGSTLATAFRIEQLKKLHSAVKKYEAEINEALNADLGKSRYEAFMCEIGLALSEISYMIRHLRNFSRTKSVRTPLSQFPSRSYTQPTPYGNTLILCPWNYPFLLAIEPLTDAIAAGNTAIIKPSAYSPKTAAVLEKVIGECFPPEYVAVVTGGRQENQTLLQQKFDMIFFTGSEATGKEVLRHAAENLTPAILELGGKSPCIVDASADIELAAKRIVFGKFINCGQTCVAPDHIICESCKKDKLVEALKEQIKLQYGSKPLENQDYGKIINDKHFRRLTALIDRNKLVYGGELDEAAQRIEPTILDNVTYDDPVMQEEIFGPILPVLSFDNFEQLMDELKSKAEPLALYIFSNNRKRIERVTKELSYGGGCINDVIIHLATSEMGFGGVGASGMGSYHGKAGFDAFSHYKSIVDKKTWLDLPMRYQPYKNRLYEKLVHLFLR